MTKYAVLIGNSEFPDEPELKTLICPVQDVKGLAAILKSDRGEFSVSSLINQASYQILDALEDVVNAAKKDDLLLIYYSGHDKCNGIANILHLTTHDTRVNKLGSKAISIQRVYDILAMGKCKQVIIILDCCYSGAAAQGFKGSSDDQLQQSLNNNKRAGTYLVTSSSKEQLSEDGTIDGYSLFTQHLITGLETGDADKDGDGLISMNELYDYVHDNVIAENPNQQPTKHVKEERGSLMIAKSGLDARADRAKKIADYLYSLEREERISYDIFNNAVGIIRKSVQQLSELEKTKDKLISDLFVKKNALNFNDAWGKLPTTELITEKAEQEKAKQAQLARDQEAQDKAAREKAEQEKIKQAQLARDKEAQDKAAREQAEQEKAKQAQLARDKEAQDKAAKEQADNQDQYGRYFDLTVNNVTQRFRWIKAGTFLMGSPASEAERSADEKQHSVTLSQGYWLADTACTQALWLAVMANNPAMFKEDVNNPVEQVSWNDVQAFLIKLKHLIPDLNARLPTEAEWEYACRAGTTTAFSFGNTITPEQVNYAGSGFFGGLFGNTNKDLYREKTVAVKSLPPNAWGLYEMHGNVWEWCNDWKGDYPNEPVTNPTGVSKPRFPASRVLRGGSWSYGAGNTRSASRFSYTPDIRYDLFGFRFALGQTAS